MLPQCAEEASMMPVIERDAVHAEVAARAIFHQAGIDIPVVPSLDLGAHGIDRRAPGDAAKAGRLILIGARGW
jgi:hypothetical protein